MKRFGILQTAFPARGSIKPNAAYIPPITWRLYYLAGRRYGLEVLFFRSDDVDFRNKRVHAWSSDSKDGLTRWKRSWNPMPHVLYGNYPVGIRGQGMGAVAVKRRFTRMGIPVFNPPFFTKSSLEQILRRSEKTKKFLPPTQVVKSPQDVINYLEKYSVVYLKPNNGFQGRGICQISKLSGMRIDFKSDKFDGNKPFHKIFTSSNFIPFMKKRVNKQRYLVQKGLSLITKGNRKIDFRVEIHRGIDGKWHSAGIRPKLGKVNAIVTNTHAGGTKTTWEAIEQWAKQEGKRLPTANNIEEAAITAANHLTRLRPTLSHMGVDVGVDDTGNIHLLDFNTIPGKDLLTYDMLLRVTDFTAGFAKYLTRNK